MNIKLKLLIKCDQFQASRRVDDLFEDLRDGHNLLSLLEVLSGEHLVSSLFQKNIYIFSISI